MLYTLRFWNHLLHSIITVMDNWYAQYTVLKNSTANALINDEILIFFRDKNQESNK